MIEMPPFGFGDDLDSLARSIEDGMQYIDHTLIGQIVPYVAHEEQTEFKVVSSVITPGNSVVLYEVNGLKKSESGEVSKLIVNKRYNDFVALREALIDHWPGFYIPSLPPSKIIVSLIFDHKSL